ncbi:hypothetical protein, partial [Rhodococcus jostii]|uniref:hypothetical protein n=1 Tax=Rhodococcus jostii TaxID=132919 RepID=UPI00363BD771
IMVRFRDRAPGRRHPIRVTGIRVRTQQLVTERSTGSANRPGMRHRRLRNRSVRTRFRVAGRRAGTTGIVCRRTGNTRDLRDLRVLGGRGGGMR